MSDFLSLTLGNYQKIKSVSTLRKSIFQCYLYLAAKYVLKYFRLNEKCKTCIMVFCIKGRHPDKTNKMNNCFKFRLRHGLCLQSELLLPVFACLPLVLFQVITRSSRRERSHRLSLSDEFCYFLSFQFSRSVVSDSLRPHGLQHARPPCLSLCPRVCSNSCPLSQ